nr:inactive leucine-rich repeat receptor-like serine/threonine-protein kinase At1g60630 [Allium cepa]
MNLFSLPFFLFLLLPAINNGISTEDAKSLLFLKTQIDPSNFLNYSSTSISSLCTSWEGVKECNSNGRVTKLVLEYLNLSGTLDAKVLAKLDQIRVLSFKSNSLYGNIPDLSLLYNLKSIYLNDNKFTGKIPSSIASVHRLKIIVLSDNLLSGQIPESFTRISRLYTLFLQNNNLSGEIPRFDQRNLKFFNVSNNNFSGEIPSTKTLNQFNATSFLNIPNLCGFQIGVPCNKSLIIAPGPSPNPLTSFPIHASHKKKRRKLLIILASSISAFVLLFIVFCSIGLLICKKKKKRDSHEVTDKPSVEESNVASAATAIESRGVKREFSWENEGLGKLVFCGGVTEMYSLEDLLKASAETLGRGTVGSTYKAIMESGFIVTVKRLKDSGHLGVDEFRRRMEEIGRLRHPNLVPLRAYFQAKEERLLVYDYFPNGSLFSLIHGSRPSGTGKPLHWTSCLKIAEDVATGLLYLHQSNHVHGNLKSSNVLLGSDFESCLTDFALLPNLLPPDSTSSTSTSSSLFYRAPESRSSHHSRSTPFTPQSDIYSFGVLLLELLTGKTPFHDLVEQYGSDIPVWVKSVREEEEAGSGGDESSSSEEKLSLLVDIARMCVVKEVERRPEAKEVVRMVKEARAEGVVVSSNSSDHSPGRWSDTVQSLPREYGSEHSGFAERD